MKLLMLALSFSALGRAEMLGYADLLKLASQRSENLGIARQGLEIAASRRRQALGAWLPQLNVKAGEAFADLGNRDFQSPSARLNLREDLFTGLDQPAALKGGDAQELQAKAALEAAQRAVENELGTAYFKVLQVEEELESERAVAKLATDAVAELRSRVALGRNRRAEQSSAEAQVARVQATLASLEGDRAEARETLASLCGVPVEQALAPVAVLPESATALSEMQARLASLPALEVLRQNLALAEAAQLAAKGAFLPSLYAEGNWYLARQNGASGSSWDANIGLDLPLFRGGSLIAKKRAADAAVESARLQLAKAERESGRELRQAWQGLASALAQAEASRLALEAAERSHKDQMKDFKNALVTSLDLLSAFQIVESSRLEYLRARYNAHRAALRLRLASGANSSKDR